MFICAWKLNWILIKIIQLLRWCVKLTAVDYSVLFIKINTASNIGSSDGNLSEVVQTCVHDGFVVSQLWITSSLLHSSHFYSQLFNSSQIQVNFCHILFLNECGNTRPLHPNIDRSAYSPYYSPYISEGADKENLFESQEPLKLATVWFILITIIVDLVVILWGEVRF